MSHLLRDSFVILEAVTVAEQVDLRPGDTTASWAPRPLALDHRLGQHPVCVQAHVFEVGLKKISVTFCP